LRYFAGVAEEQHFGRAAERLHIAQPALSRQIQDLEKEISFRLFDRLPRGVRLNAAGKLFLNDARRILQDVQDAGLRAGRVANGKAGTLRMGFVESVSWHGIVPDSFRKFRQNQPDAELEIHPMLSVQMVEAVQSGKLDGAFIFSLDEPAGDLDYRMVMRNRLVLAAPKDHPLTRLKRLRLRDLGDTPIIWIHRWANPVLHDRFMQVCIRGGLTAPRIVQRALDSATMMSLVACRLGVTFAGEATRWHLPPSVTLLPVVDLNFWLPFYLIWKKDNPSPLLQKFVAQVKAL
jgi:DNA-binding transcriptional LysR family regulator